MPKIIGTMVEDGLGSEKWVEATRYARQMLLIAQKQRTEKRETKWKQSEAQYTGDHWPSTSGVQDPTADLIVINMSFSTVNTIVPYISGADPQFMITPWSVDATLTGARAQEAWLNRWWGSLEAGAGRAVQGAAQDSLIYGDGYAKVSFTISDREGKSVGDLFADRVDPWNIWVDPMATGFHDARWVCERIRTNREELEASGAYDNIPDEFIGIGEEGVGSADELHQRPADDGKHWMDLYEFWDKVEIRLIVFAAQGDRPLKVVEGARCPIVNLTNHWLPKQPYHMGELEQIWSLQTELNKSRSQMLTHRRRNIPKFLVKSDALDAETEDALSSQVVNQMVKIKGDRPLSDVIAAVGLTPLTSEQYNVSELITRDVYEVTGVNEYLRGATPEIRRTATEASIIEGASNIKTAHKLRKVEVFTRQIAAIVLDMAADVFPLTDYEEMNMLISGRDAQAINTAMAGEHMADLQARGANPEVMVLEAQGMQMSDQTELNLGPDLFKGLYTVEVLQNSTELRNPIFKEQKYREMAVQCTQLAPVLAQYGVVLNLRKLYEQWFEASGITNLDEMFREVPQQPMMQQPQQPPGMGQQTGGGDLSSLLQGQPNLAAAMPPSAALTALNTGQNPPA